MSTACLLGLGEVGAILNEHLIRGTNIEIVVWDTRFPVAESLVTARHYGAESGVLCSLNDQFSHRDWTTQVRYMISRSFEHGEQCAGEVREAAKTSRESNIEPWMSEACSKRQRWAGRLPVFPDERELSAMLDASVASLQNTSQSPVS